LFFGDFGFLQLAVCGEFDGAGENQFLARVFGNRAADFGFFQGEVIEVFLGARREVLIPAGPAPTIKRS
jgi:hypothetical protein